MRVVSNVVDTAKGEESCETQNREHRHRGVLLTVAPCASGTRDASTANSQTAEVPTFTTRGTLCESYRIGLAEL